MDETEEDRERIAENQSLYLRGYKYGNQGKYPQPADMEEEWNEGYEDGRADWLASINWADFIG